MIHNEVYKKFTSLFPEYAGNKVDCWFPNGKNSVRVRHKDKREFIFTYMSEKDWKLETLDSHIKALYEKNTKKGASK